VRVFLLQTDAPINSSSDSAFLVIWKQLVALNIIPLLKPQGQAKVLSLVASCFFLPCRAENFFAGDFAPRVSKESIRELLKAKRDKGHVYLRY